MKHSFKTMSLFFLSFITFISFTSCKKNKSSSDTTNPIIAIVEPTDLDTLKLSVESELHIEFTASDNSSLHSLEVNLLDSSNAILFQSTPNVMDQTSYAFHSHYIPIGITGLTWMKITIKATDHSSNIAEKVLKVYVKP
jgi:hypothetical protein